VPTPSFESALQGKAAGVQIVQGSGMAGAGSVVRIRGVGSVSAGGDPLYVVDGVPISQDPFLNANRGGMNNNPLATLNPNDIESVEILKDAGAAGIYGSRGANGVILITTKRGVSGKPTFNFNTRFGISQPTVKTKFVNGSQWLQLRQEAWENDGNTGPAPLPTSMSWEEARKYNTDWYDLTTQTGVKQEYNLSMSQGTQKLKTYVGLSYSDNASYLKGNSYERLAGRANIDYNFTDRLKASLSSSLSRGQNNRVDAAWSGGLGAAMSTALPIYPVRKQDGEYFANGNNPVRQQELVQLRTVETRAINNLSLEYEPINNLTLKAVGGLDYMDLNDQRYQPKAFLNSDHAGTADRFPSWVTNYNTTLTATYNYRLSNDHRFTFLLGSEYQKSVTKKYDRITETDIYGPIYTDPQRGDSTKKQIIGAADQVWSFISYFTRVNYTLKDRYIFQVMARVDGSSRFGINNRYGFFPTASAAWIISEEEFLKDNPVISLLKIRSSYGITGNANIENYARWGTYSPQTNSNPYNGQPTIYPLRLDNPNLKWETLTSIDASIELGLFKDRITTELSFYNKDSRDVLMNRQNALSSGFDKYYQNVGQIRNRGVEFSINSRNIEGEFSWTTNFNIAKNNNKVIDIGDLTPDAVGGGTNDTRIIPGQPVGANYLVRYYGVDPADGLPIWLDKDGYQTKTFSLDDRVVVGSVIPDFTGGITNEFRYKGFDFSFLWIFTKGGNIYDGSGKRQLGIVTDWNIREEIGDRWRQPGDIAKYPRLTLKPSTYPGLPDEWNYNSTLFLYDASYARLRTVTFGYNLPTGLANKFKLTNARVFLTGFNLVTFTRYPGGDPEIARDFENPADRNMSPNITYLTPPQERSFTLGLNVSF
jgi:TonB-linked SusC/RagA family outer membrane protein